MRKFTYAIFLMACFLSFSGGIYAIGSSNADKTIVLLTDPAHGSDTAHQNWLISNGFKVVVIDVTDALIADPTPEFMTSLNDADLVISGRDAWSNVQQAIDSTTTPVIHTNPFGAQWGSPDAFWFLSATVNYNEAKAGVKLNVTNDPIFQFATVMDGKINYASSLGTVNTALAHNGTVIGTLGSDLAIVRFAKNVPYNSGTTAKTPNSDHTIIPFQTVSPTAISLKADGQAVYYAEIRRLLGLPIEAPKVYAGNNEDKTIVLLTDPAHGSDTANEKWLLDNGFMVTKIDVTDALIGSPTPEFMTALNSADLVISGRDAWSNVQQAIDSTTTPVIHTNPFGAQWGSPDAFWFLAATVNYNESKAGVKLTVTDDPIFQYTGKTGGTINYASSMGSVATTSAHNGSVIGTLGSDLAIIRFAANTPYNSDPAAKTPNSDHTILPFQTVDANSISLNGDGQAVYYAEIRRLLGLSIEAPKVFMSKNESKTIVLLTDPAHGSDTANEKWLIDNGFMVTKIDVTDELIGNPTPEFMTALNGANLVISGRDAWSNVQQAIDSTTTPVIHTNPFGAQWGSPDAFWFLGATVNYVEAKGGVKLNVTNDPIFQFTSASGAEINYAGSMGTITTASAHNGSVIGTNDGNIAIVRFAANTPYNSDALAKTPNSDHTIIPFQTVNATMISLNADGQAVYYAEICRLMGLPISAPKVTLGSNSDKKIALLTDPAHGSDTAQEAWLMKKGFTVNKIDVTDELIGNPTPEFMTALNEADLVISGRDAWSNVQQAVDSTTTPVIHTNPFGAQWGSPDAFWFLGATVNYVEDANGVNLSVNNDPIFQYANAVGGSVNYATSLGTITTAQPHNGTVIGTNAGNIAIVRFKANVPYNSDPMAKTPNSDHTLIPFQTVDANSISLTADGGMNVYYAEIRRMLGLSIESNTELVTETPADKSLIVLTDDSHGGDHALITFLTGNGFQVTKRLINDAIIADPPVSLMDSLNMADLVVYGRDAWSNVQQAADMTTTPVIHANPYGAQWGAPDKFWFLDAMMNTVSDSIWIKVTNDPIFANSNMAGDSVKYATGAAFTITSLPHNGSVIGTYGGDIGIVRFAKGVPYNADPAAKTPNSDHTIFPFQTGTKTWTLTHDGQNAYYAEICRMTGLKITLPAFYYNNPSTNSTLASLTALKGTLSPVFSPTETVYTLTVPSTNKFTGLTAKAADEKATVTGAGPVNTIPSTVTITVTAEDGSTTDYIVEVVRPTGISDLMSAGIRMYPNPARESIKIEGSGIGSIVSLINVNGQVVYKTNSAGVNIECNLAGIRSGIYLMKVEQDGKAYSSKFIKQ